MKEQSLEIRDQRSESGVQKHSALCTLRSELPVHLRTGSVISLREPSEVEGRQVWPVDLHILTGEPLYADGLGVDGKTGWFEIDLASVEFHKPRLTLDYNHDEREVIGYVEDFTLDETGLHGRGYLVPFRDDDRASEIIYKSKAGIPWEVSPTILPYDSEIEDIPGDEPKRLYKKLPIRGIAICPYGTDRKTSATVLSERKNMPIAPFLKSKATLSEEEKKPIDVPEPPPQDEEKLSDAPENAAHPDLEEFIAEFGFEAGVNYFRAGMTIDEARQEEYAQLKAEKMAALKEKEPATDTPPAKATGELATLNDAVTKLSQQVARMTASMPRGEREPVSSGEPEKNQPKDKRPVVQQQAEAYAKKFGPK